MSLKQVAKVMNKSVQGLIHEADRGEKNFKKGDGRLPISFNNGFIGAMSDRPRNANSHKDLGFLKSDSMKGVA
jgi:hypothetical protein